MDGYRCFCQTPPLLDGEIEIISENPMRFFIAVCGCCLLVATVGCMTKNWSVPIFKQGALTEMLEEQKEAAKTRRSFWNSKFGEASGLDPRSREIEKRLGL